MVDPFKAARLFAADYRHMEYTLKRSDFLRTDKKVAEADWDLLAKSLGPAFFEQIVETRIAETLINIPPRRLLANMQWSPPHPTPLKNVAQLIVNGVCRVRNNYIHGEKFTGGPEGQWDRDTILIVEAHAVLKQTMQFRAEAAPLKSRR